MQAASNQHNEGQTCERPQRDHIGCLRHEIILHVVDTRRVDEVDELRFIVDQRYGFIEDVGEVGAADGGAREATSAAEDDSQEVENDYN